MKAYAIAHLRQVRMGPDIRRYLERIDATLAPFGGSFIVHGGPLHQLEGAFSADVIVIGFPDMQAARGWYGSPAYQAILPLRSANAEGDAFLIEGVDAAHKATDILA